MPTKECNTCAVRDSLSADPERHSGKRSARPFAPGQGEWDACPDCGRWYLRTRTNAVAPGLRPVVVARAAPVMTEPVQVLRCPSCGSTRVTENTWPLLLGDEVRLACDACHREDSVVYPARDGWITLLDLPKGQRVLPDFIALADEGPAVAVERPAPRTPAPAPQPAPVKAEPEPRAPPAGCPRCTGASAGDAWAAVKGSATHTFANEPHYGVHATRCACGQPFVFVFTERVDYQDGFDTQVELAVALWSEELGELQGMGSAVGTKLTRLAQGRPFLMKSTGNEPRWVDRGFSIGPYG